MEVLVFDLRGSVAHFRRPDTTATHATYPFITRTALRGLLGAILGLEEFTSPDALAGIRLLSPVRKSVQELSMLGKGFLSSGPEFNRPTSIELLVKPHYRIFYAGPYLDELAEAIEKRHSVYPTYLGCAYALTVPENVGIARGIPYEVHAGGVVTTATVVPTNVVRRLVMRDGLQMARSGGVLYQYLGGRRFRGTINLLYEVNGRPITFEPADGPYVPRVEFVQLGEEGIVCLW